MPTPDDDMVTVTLQIPRSALILQQAPPELLSQKNATDVCGIPRRQFLEMLRICPLPVAKVGRLRLVDRMAFLDWVKSTAEVSHRQARSRPPNTIVAQATTPSCPAEVLAYKLGAEVSRELAEAAAAGARESERSMTSLLQELGLVLDTREPEQDLNDARRAVKWAAEKLGDRQAFERFAAELGEQECPSCHRWTDESPCTACKAKAREAARVPCVDCGKRIDPCKDGLCYKCRKAKKLAAAVDPALQRGHSARKGPRRRSPP